MRPFPGPLKRAPDGYHPIILNKEQKAWLRETFPVTENPVVVRAMGISYPTLYRLVKSLRIKKSVAGMKTIKQRQGNTHKRMNRQNRLLMLSGKHPDECTNIRVSPYSKPQSHCKYRAVALYGYIVYSGYDMPDDDPDRYKIFYDENTKRSARFEATCQRYGFTIEKFKNP